MDIFEIQILNMTTYLDTFWVHIQKISYFVITLVPTGLLQLPNTLCFFCKKVAMFFPLVGTSVNWGQTKPINTL